MEFGVLYLPSGWHRECANEAQARDTFDHAPQGDGETAVLTTSRLRAAFHFPNADRAPLMREQIFTRIKPAHGHRSILRHAVSPTKQEYEIIQRPTASARRDVLDGVESAPAAGQGGDEVWHERKGV